MEDNILALGKTITCMAMESILGKMGVGMKAFMKWIKSMGLGFTNGLMVDAMKGIG